MKIKELIKTIILTGLVIFSVVLSSKIWFSKELWPDGYNSFNYASNSNIFSKIFSNKNKGKALELSQIFSPKQILINKDNSNILLKAGNDENENLNTLLKEKLKTVILNGSFSESTEEEYKKVSKSNSIFIDFYNNISFEMLADYYRAPVNSNILEISNVEHILFDIKDDTKLGVYTKNNKNGKIYKSEIDTNIKEITSLCTSLLKKVPEGTISSSFAFENSFDKKTEEDSGRLLLDSFMLINLTSTEITDITPTMLFDTANDLYLISSDYFNINTNSARQFIDSSGTINLIENFATLKFHRDGLIQYDSTSSTQGIELKGSFTSDYDVVKLVGEFTEYFNSNFNLPDKNKYVFSGVVKDSESQKYTICFDILYNGVPVIFKRQISDNEVLTHAIEIEFLNGRIISYKQMLCGFNKTRQKSEVPPMIMALDKFYTAYDVEKNPDVIINDIYNIYHYDLKENTVETKCAVSLSNKEVIIVKP